MDLLYGIDGTGPFSDSDYAKDFADSHVRRMTREWHTPMVGYARGPSVEGLATELLAKRGFEWVRDRHKILTSVASSGDAKHKDLAPRVFLTGYSRGGAAVTALSHMLRKIGIDVHALLLFDAVNQSMADNTEVIPANVRMAFHAMRDPRAGSREFFGNCATKHVRSERLVKELFYCTHGGVGGVPWKENGKSGKIEEFSTAEKTAIVGGAAIAGPLGIYKAKKWADKNDFTNVTVAQDNTGKKESWDWMSQKLRQAKTSNLNKTIGSVGDFNLSDRTFG